MPNSRIPSPARSHGAPVTPRRYKTRKTRSVGSPARSTASGRLSNIVDSFKENNIDSFAVSPLSKTVLSDNTEIEMPRRQSWWKKVENSRDVIEVLENEQPVNPINVLKEFDIEVLSQEKKNFIMDIPESSDNESINSIVVPQRKLFNQKENQPHKEFGEVIGCSKSNKTNFEDKTLNVGTKILFGKTSKKRPVFDISPDKTQANKTEDLAVETKAKVKNLFGAGTKRKNLFADFTVSESEDEIPEIQPKYFAFHKQPEPIRRSSTASRGMREQSPVLSITTDIEMDDWNMLPSSTMVEHQLDVQLTTPGKRARLSKLSEAKETTNIDSTKQSDKSMSSKNKSKNVSKNQIVDRSVSNNNKTKSPVKDENVSKKHDNTQNKSKTDQIISIHLSQAQNISEIFTEHTEEMSYVKSETYNINKTINKQQSVNQNSNNYEEYLDVQVVGSMDQKEMPIGELVPAADEQNEDVDINLTYDDNDPEDLQDDNDEAKTLIDDKTCHQNQTAAIQNEEVEEQKAKDNLGQYVQEENNKNQNLEALAENEKTFSCKGNDGVLPEQELVVDKDKREAGEKQIVKNKDENTENKTEICRNGSTKAAHQLLLDEDEENAEKILSAQNKDKNPKEIVQNQNEEITNASKEQKFKNSTAVYSRKREVNNEVVNDNETREREIEDSHNKVQNASQEIEEEEEVHNNSRDVVEGNEASDDEVQNESQEIEEDVESKEIEEETVTSHNEAQSGSQVIEEEEERNEDVEKENEALDIEVQNESHEIEEEEQNVDVEEDIEASDNEVQTESQEIEEEEEQNEDVGDENNASDNEIQNESQEIEETENNVSHDGDEEMEASDDEVQNAIQDVEEELHNEIIESDDEIQNEDQDQDESREMEERDDDDAEDDSGQNECQEMEDIQETGDTEHQQSEIEEILHHASNEIDSFTAGGRNTSIRKTKSIIKNFSMRPSLSPPRISTGLSDGSKNSSAEGSGWDSHGTTRKTLRQTFGKDFTPRKSLRTLVMEKSAKRQTIINEANAGLKLHQANASELYNQDDQMDYEENVEEESSHEVSRATRQTTLEMYLAKIKNENVALKQKLEEQVKISLNSISTRDFLNFRVPNKPSIRRANMKSLQTAPKIKRSKPSAIPLQDLPPELVEDMKYKPPKRFRPSNAAWITKRLYKFLETKLEPKYDYKARVRAEKLVETIYNFVREIKRLPVAPPRLVADLQREMARLDIVHTHFEFYNFFGDYMPVEVKVKVVPDIVNDIPLPREGVFAPISV